MDIAHPRGSEQTLGLSIRRAVRVKMSTPAVEHLALAEVALASEQSSIPDSHTLAGNPGRSPKASMPRILVVEDDEPLSRFLQRTLGGASYGVELAHDGNVALQLLHPATDLVILDINLPGRDGLSVLRALRPQFPKLPVLVLTARSRTEDMVMALESGADDCLIKPFSYLELLARVRALLRRNTGVLPNESRVADLVLFREEHRVERNGRRVDLTPREFALLEYLIRTPCRPVSRATLMKEVWDAAFDPSTNVVDVYMKYLRDKVDLPSEIKLIQTVRGVGYVVSDQ